MTRYNPEEIFQVHLVPAVANINAPTLAELAAGDDITKDLVTMDTPLEGSTTDDSDLSSAYNKTAPSTYGGQPITAEFKRHREYALDLVFNALGRLSTGFFVVARRGPTPPATALAAGDRVDVWPYEVVTRTASPPVRGERVRFTLSASVPEEPAEDVALVA